MNLITLHHHHPLDSLCLVGLDAITTLFFCWTISHCLNFVIFCSCLNLFKCLNVLFSLMILISIKISLVLFLSVFFEPLCCCIIK